jgi:hypothetical protein
VVFVRAREQLGFGALGVELAQREEGEDKKK